MEVVSFGDKFTVYDSNNVAQGTMEVLKIEVRVIFFHCFFFACRKKGMDIYMRYGEWMRVCSLPMFISLFT